MKLTSEICQEAETEFSDSIQTMEPGHLFKMADEWLEDMNIVSYKLDHENSILIIIAESDCKDGTYSVFRFFLGGETKWAMSVDLNKQPQVKVFDYLLNHFK